MEKLWKILKKTLKILWTLLLAVLVINAVLYLFVPHEFFMRGYPQTLYAEPDSPQAFGEEIVYRADVEAFLWYNSAYIYGTVTLDSHVLEIFHEQNYPRSLWGEMRYSWKYMGSYPWDYNKMNVAARTENGYYVILEGYYDRGFDTVTIYASEADYKEMKNGSRYYTESKYHSLFGEQ